jgi:hypothetical protein
MSLVEQQHLLNGTYVGGIDNRYVGEVTFLLLGFLGQNVTFERMFATQFSFFLITGEMLDVVHANQTKDGM